MRYPIEVANGRVKNKWHLFGKIIPSILTKNLMSDYKIGAALLNIFGKPILCNKDDFQEIGTKMIALINKKNQLEKKVESKAFKRTERTYFECVEPKRIEFPRLNQKEMKMLSLGTYSIKQAVSYTAEHIKTHGRFEVFTLPTVHIWAHFGDICTSHLNNPRFISAKIKSRFRGAIFHKVYILYDSIQKKLFLSMYLPTWLAHCRVLFACDVLSLVLWLRSL